MIFYGSLQIFFNKIVAFVNNAIWQFENILKTSNNISTVEKSKFDYFLNLEDIKCSFFSHKHIC
jgi:hypothetical protein